MGGVLKRLGFALLATFALGCGGETGSDSGASSGGSGGSTQDAGLGGTSSGGASGGSGGLSLGGSGGTSTGGSGGIATSCGPIDPGTPCNTLVEAQCLAAHPRCAPLYDDLCCPACDPTAPCADCVNMGFIGCTELGMSNCVPGATGPCGMTPDWACSGGSATCPGDGPCNSVPGCVEANPSPCADPPCAPECHPLTKDSCFVPCVTGTPPYCGGESAQEATPTGYTGFCISPQACGCPSTAPTNETACTLTGIHCGYGNCSPQCDCVDGLWECWANPC
jgi:hypothetical protein